MHLFTYPPVTVIVFEDMFFFQFGYIHEGKSSETTKKEYVFYQIQAFRFKLFFSQDFQFFLFEKFLVTFSSLILILAKGSLVIHSFANARLVTFFRHLI